MKSIVKNTGLAILIFFSGCFIQVLFQLNSPLHRQTDNRLDIGFPFTYYYQFVMDKVPNSGWNPAMLLLDCAIVWLVTMAIVYVTRKNR
jgi:hypothetical protein